MHARTCPSANRRTTMAMVATTLALLGAGCAIGGDAAPVRPPAATAAAIDRAALAEQVRAAETAFAKSMADRDFAAFAAFVSEDAVFVNGGKPLRGKAAVLAHWKRFFDRPEAPFAWKPELVEVLGDGTLGYSEGPVTLPDGRVPARYFSTWRREADGRWRVAFDNGYDVCPEAAR